ncbi:MAG: hypothetical protein ACLU5J_09480 [Christensenellales bacterium]
MDKRSAMTIFVNNPTRMHKTPLLKLSRTKKDVLLLIVAIRSHNEKLVLLKGEEK